jgi:hypothetical protein
MMGKFKMLGGTHATGDGRYYDVPGSIVEEDAPLDRMFPGHFELVDDNARAAQAIPTPGADVVRRTAASEAQKTQQRNRGNEQPVGSAPGDHFDQKNAQAAKEVKEEFTGQFHNPNLPLPGSPSGTVPPPVDQTGRVGLQRATAGTTADTESASAASGEETGEGQEGGELEDVSDQFPKAEEAGLTVWQSSKDKHYFVYKGEEVVGEAEGYSNKRDTNSFLSAKAKESAETGGEAQAEE